MCIIVDEFLFQEHHLEHILFYNGNFYFVLFSEEIGEIFQIFQKICSSLREMYDICQKFNYHNAMNGCKSTY